MKKKIFKSLLAIICLLCSTNASAYDFEVDGIYYNVVSLSELTCQVTWGQRGVFLLKYEGDIVIPATVEYANRTLTVIGIENDIFQNGYGSDLTGITIPNTISSIKGIFSYCPKLERVTIEDGETTLEVGDGNWKSFPIITLYIGRNLSNQSLFKTNDTIKELTIGNSVTEIGINAFEHCSGLTSVTIGNSVTKIGKSAFESCSGLTSVTIGNSVTEIGGSAFSYCSGLTSVTIPNSVTEIGEKAFYGCSGLTSVTIPNSVTEIGGGAFWYCSGLTSVTIPNSVTKISGAMFYGCSKLTSVTIPNSITKIGTNAFYGCSGLTSVTIPNSVTEIGDGVFYGCSGLTSMTIPNSVTEIGDKIFSGCSGLTTLYSLSTTPPKIGSFENNQYMTLNVFVPQEALKAYQNADIWENFWNLQGFDATGIENVKAKGNAVYHDLRGIQFDAPKRGLNIINGKKVIMK